MRKTNYLSCINKMLL